MAKNITETKAAFIQLINGMIQFEIGDGHDLLARELLWKVLPNVISSGDEMDGEQLGIKLADIYFEHIQETYFSLEHYQYLKEKYDGEITKVKEITTEDLNQLLKSSYL